MLPKPDKTMSPSSHQNGGAFTPGDACSYPYFNRTLDVKRALKPLSGLALSLGHPLSFDAHTLYDMAQSSDDAFRDLVDFSAVPLWPIALLHRGGGAHVNFLKKPQSSPTPNARPVGFGIAGLPVDQVIAEWPKLSTWLQEDGYFSVNSSYRGAPWLSKETGYPGPWRKEKHLKSLNACYVDLDVGRPESDNPAQRLSWREALSKVLELSFQGVLPMPSMVSLSGRGLHLYWVLEGLMHLFYPHAMGRRNLWHDLWFYKHVNKALASILQLAGADVGSFDAARVLRVPGTRHSTSGHRTLFLLVEDYSLIPKKPSYSRVRSYTIDRLADFLGVQTIDATPPLLRDPTTPDSSQESGDEGAPLALPYVDVEDVVVADTDAAVTRQSQSVTPLVSAPSQNDDASPAKDDSEVIIVRTPKQFHDGCRRGYLGRKQLYTLRFKDIELIEQKRRGWKRGHRRSRLYLYAMMLRGAGYSTSKVLSLLRPMASRCKPPYPSDGSDTPLSLLVQELFAEPLRFYRNTTLVSLLGVTPELARTLNLATIVPPGITGERKPPGGRRGQQQVARRAFVRDYLAQQNSSSASCRLLQSVLQGAGFAVSHETVNQDLRALRDEALNP